MNELFEARENQTLRNLNDDFGAIGVMVKLSVIKLKVYGEGSLEIGLFVMGSLLAISSALEKLIFVLFME